MDLEELSSLTCIVCYENYDTGRRAPCIASCGHSVCSICYHNIQPKCPMCKTAGSFARKQINFQLMNVIEELEKFKYKFHSKLDKNCIKCKKEVSDDESYICISCTTCVKGASVDDFLDRANKNRFCEGCKNLDKPHEPRRLRGVEMSIKSKQFAKNAKFGNCRNVISELDHAVSEARTSISMIEKQFPFGKKISGESSKHTMEDIKASANASLEKAAQTVMEGIAAMYTMADKLAEISNSLSTLPNVVNLNPQDDEFLETIKFSEDSSFFDNKMMHELNSIRSRKCAYNSNTENAHRPFGGLSDIPTGGFEFPSAVGPPYLLDALIDSFLANTDTPQTSEARGPRDRFLKNMIAFFTKK